MVSVSDEEEGEASTNKNRAPSNMASKATATPFTTAGKKSMGGTDGETAATTENDVVEPAAANQPLLGSDPSSNSGNNDDGKQQQQESSSSSRPESCSGSNIMRFCIHCQSPKRKSDYAPGEWQKGPGQSQCQDCCCRPEEEDGNDKDASRNHPAQDEKKPKHQQRSSLDVLVDSPEQQPRKRPRRQPPQKAAPAARPSLYDDDDDSSSAEDSSSEEDDDDDNGGDDDPPTPLVVSLNSLKRKVMGRDLIQSPSSPATALAHCNTKKEDLQMAQIRALISNDNDNDINDSNNNNNNNNNNNSSQVAQQLAKELQCVICQEVFYPPVSLPCGHSFCQGCLDWWWFSDRNTNNTNSNNSSNNCPTCRQPLHCSKLSLKINTALRAVVSRLYSHEILQRLQDQKQQKLTATKGEAGSGSGDYQVIVTPQDWQPVELLLLEQSHDDSDDGNETISNVQVRRNIVMDADDARMQLALALYDKPRWSNNNDENGSSPHGRSFQIQIALVTMEEDEVAEGFPLLVEPDSDDEAILCTTQQASFVLEVQLKTKDEGLIVPLARLTKRVESPGFVTFTLHQNSMQEDSDDHQLPAVWEWDNVDSLLFCHAETKTELQVKLEQPGRGGKTTDGYTIPRKARTSDSNKQLSVAAAFVHDRRDADEEEEDGPTGKNVDHYEDDGFLVGDDEEIEMEDDDDDERDHFVDHHRHGGNGDDAMSDVDEEAEFSSAAEDGGGQYHGGNDSDEDVDDEDLCCICKDGGELMVCDGGDHLQGCNKSFHASCVSLEEIPDGDWVCQSCARAGGFADAGRQGHEFPEDSVTADNSKSNSDQQPERMIELLGDDSSSEDEEEDEGLPKQKSNNNRRKQVILDDSDSD